jgi:hypothetical protein
VIQLRSRNEIFHCLVLDLGLRKQILGLLHMLMACWIEDLFLDLRVYRERLADFRSKGFFLTGIEPLLALLVSCTSSDTSSWSDRSSVSAFCRSGAVLLRADFAMFFLRICGMILDL